MVRLEAEVERMVREKWNDPKYAGPPRPEDFLRAIPADDAKREYILSSEDLKHLPHLTLPSDSKRVGEKSYLPEDLEQAGIRKWGEMEFYLKRAERKRHEISLQREQLKEQVMQAPLDSTSRNHERMTARHRLALMKHKAENEPAHHMPGI